MDTLFQEKEAAGIHIDNYSAIIAFCKGVQKYSAK